MLTPNVHSPHMDLRASIARKRNPKRGHDLYSFAPPFCDEDAFIVDWQLSEKKSASKDFPQLKINRHSVAL